MGRNLVPVRSEHKSGTHTYHKLHLALDACNLPFFLRQQFLGKGQRRRRSAEAQQLRRAWAPADTKRALARKRPFRIQLVAVSSSIKVLPFPNFSSVPQLRRTFLKGPCHRRKPSAVGLWPCTLSAKRCPSLCRLTRYTTPKPPVFECKETRVKEDVLGRLFST